MSEPGTVLLLAPDDAPTAGQMCQNLLTTAHECRESILAIDWETNDSTWLDQLSYDPINLRRERIQEVSELKEYIQTFLNKLGEDVTGVVYFDSVADLVSKVGEKTAANALSDSSRMLASAGVTGFFRVDPGLIDMASLESCTGYTATYGADEKRWQLSKS